MTVAAAEWRNWSGFVSARPECRVAPKDQDELSEAIRSAPGPIRIEGTGHSFTPLVRSDGTILSLEKFAGLISHDPEKLLATVGAGTQIGALAKMLFDIGQALPNMGDIDKQAFGGALGTSTHGSGITLCAYPAQLEAIEITDGLGVPRTFDRTRDADAMSAMAVSLGSFGAVTAATIRNVGNYRLRRKRWVEPLEEVLDEFESIMTSKRSMEFFYIPFSGQAMLLSSEVSQDATSPRPVDTDNESVKLLELVRDLTLRAPWLRRLLLGAAIKVEKKQDYVGDWLRVYASERDVKFNEMEYHLPIEEGPAVIRDVISQLENSFPEVYFPIEVRVVAPDENWLSPFYRRPSCSVAIHHGVAQSPIAFFNSAETIFRRHGGRPHWGKMHSLTARELSALYPRWKDAMDVRREMDPENRFVSPYIARLLGIDV